MAYFMPKIAGIGSVTIDEDLMDAANFIENEQVHILNKNNLITGCR